MIIFRKKQNKPLYDLAICFDPLSFLHVFSLKRFFSVKKIIYYNVDYSKNRFYNSIINFIYQKINIFSYEKCDYFFYISKLYLDDIDPFNKIKTAGNIFKLTHTIKPLIKKERAKKIPNSIIFAGTLNENIEFNDLMAALKEMKDDGKQFVFDIYGRGTQEKNIASLIAKFKLNTHVRLKGIVRYSDLTSKIIPRYMIGVSLYKVAKSDNEPDFIFNADNLTTKMVEYIGRGLPIVSTIPYRYLDIIEKKKFGFLADNQLKWQEAIQKLFTDNRLYKQYSNNALLFSRNYDEEKVITPVLEIIFNNNEKT